MAGVDEYMKHRPTCDDDTNYEPEIIRKFEEEYEYGYERGRDEAFDNGYQYGREEWYEKGCTKGRIDSLIILSYIAVGCLSIYNILNRKSI